MRAQIKKIRALCVPKLYKFDTARLGVYILQKVCLIFPIVAAMEHIIILPEFRVVDKPYDPKKSVLMHF